MAQKAKRIVFCFDGTWDQLGNPWVYPTNVVLTAQSIEPRGADDTSQIIHYDQGVGTAFATRYVGGVFGFGVMGTIQAAYTFLVLNYEVGDDIFVFGFSRGAFTARAFIGMIRSVGILRRADAEQIYLAVSTYKKRKKNEDHDASKFLKFRLEHAPQVCMDKAEDDWRCRNQHGYVSGSNPILKIRYLGLWDTVESVGIAQGLLAPWIDINKWLGIGQFFDADLSDLVVKARHALAIDEDRVVFAPTLWSNSEYLNASLGFNSESKEAPYQQHWFPGGHGSVGGGGPVRGLSDEALDWVITGARDAGLELDVTPGSQINSLFPDPLSPLNNLEGYKPNWKDKIGDFLMNLYCRPRVPGPSRVTQIDPSAITRWRADADSLPEKKAYRPPTLADVKPALDHLIATQKSDEPNYDPDAHPNPPTAAPTPGEFYKVVLRDVLSTIAKRAYGDPSKYDEILKSNWQLLNGNADRIYPGQVLYVPRLMNSPGTGAPA
ncbi:MAG: DUF2235 domain-containing protein [Pseudomonadota bacterium]